MRLPSSKHPATPATWQSRPIKFGLHTAVSHSGSSVPYKDPWGYLRYWIRDNYDKSARADALELAKQGERFFRVASLAPSETSPLLWYYCFLNLSKAYLLKDLRYAPAEIEHAAHGLGDPADNSQGYVKLTRQKVTAFGIRSTGRNAKLQVFSALCDTLQTPLRIPDGRSEQISIKSLLSGIVSIHRAYSTAYGENLRFCRVNAEAMESRAPSGRSGEIWHWLSLDPLDVKAAGVPLKSFASSGKFGLVQPVKNGSHLLETASDRFSNNNFASKLASQRFGLRGAVHPLLLPEGYRYYVHPDGSLLRQPCSVYAVMFYLGSIVRYKPQRFASLVGNKYHWLIEEFLQICPKQFIALMVNEITDSELPFF